MDGIKEQMEQIAAKQETLPEDSCPPKASMQELESQLQKIKAKIRSGESRKAVEVMNIPKRYRGKTLLDNPIHKKAAEHILLCKSLFLTGTAGTGKTHLALALMSEWLAESFIIEDGSIYPTKGKPFFLPATELLLEIKQSWSEREGGRIASEKDILDKYTKVPLLVIDDLGAEKTSEWSRQVLYLLIDRRYRDMSQTIITSNLTHQELAEQLDDRIASRVCEMGVVIDMGKTDHRLG